MTVRSDLGHCQRPKKDTTMSSSSTPSSSSESDDDCTCNEGVSTDSETEAPAIASLRGKVAVVTAKCPRQYLRDQKDRVARRCRIPADMTKDAFLQAFRKLMATECNQSLKAATCHAVLHSKKRRSTREREKKLKLVVRMSTGSICWPGGV